MENDYFDHQRHTEQESSSGCPSFTSAELSGRGCVLALSAHVHITTAQPSLAEAGVDDSCCALSDTERASDRAIGDSASVLDKTAALLNARGDIANALR